MSAMAPSFGAPNVGVHAPGRGAIWAALCGAYRNLRFFKKIIVSATERAREDRIVLEAGAVTSYILEGF
jgi:hypothetical protein